MLESLNTLVFPLFSYSIMVTNLIAPQNTQVLAFCFKAGGHFF